jgi:(p)ppGpp synthase/HD superfamily hydrolase
MSNMHQHLHLTPWKPMATQLPPDWVELSNTLAEEVKGSFRFYVLDVVKYDAQKVGNLLRSWGLPWQVVMAGYLWEYDEDKIRHANLYDAEMVLSHINEANTYYSYIEDSVLTPLLTPPYKDLGALLIAVAIFYEALCTIQLQSNQNPYRGEKLSQIEKIGRNLLNITKSLGIWAFKREIEDLIEQIRSPRKFLEQKQEHDEILLRDADKLQEICLMLAESYQQTTQQPIKVVYTACGVTGLERRIQDAHTTATSQKAQLTGCDIVTFEVIVPTVQECYKALGIFSQLGRIQDRVTDLISNPKPNGCSHIALGLEMKSPGFFIDSVLLRDFSPTTCQIQISTPVMDAIARYGCLHPDFYATYSEQFQTGIAETLDLLGIWSSAEGSIFNALRKRFTNVPSQVNVKEPIVVYDKKRNAIILPQDATALDFAFKLDGEIGEYAVEAFINNRKAPLYRRLDAGDIVEIRTSNDVQTQSYWIEDKYAITPVAQQQIKASINRRTPTNNKGYFLIRQELERYHYILTPDELDQELRILTKRHKLEPTQKYVELIGETKELPYSPEWAGQEIMSQIAERKESIRTDTGRSNWVPKLDMPLPANQKSPRHSRICNACRPKYPHDMKIKGLLKRNGEMVVHKQSCPFLIERTVGKQSLLLSMHWQLQPPALKVAFSIISRDRRGLIHDITNSLQRFECNLISINAEAILKFKKAQVHFVLEAYADEEIQAIWQSLENIKEVLNVDLNAASTPKATFERIQMLRKQNGTISDRIKVKPTWEESVETLGLRKSELKNPYDISHPATGKMFFGRKREIQMMQRELCEGDQGKAMILYGPRRSGKSSICKHFLEHHVHPPFWHAMFSFQNASRLTEETILRQLAEKVCQKFREQLHHNAPEWQHFNEIDPQARFRKILQHCIAQAPETRLILALDEFGGALEAYDKHFIEASFITFWKDLMSEIPQLSLIFALPTSSHRTLTREFTNAFSFAEPVKVIFLDKESAEHLLVDPLKDQNIIIHPETVDLATTLTAGNPYYITLIGYQIIQQLNLDIYKQYVNDDDIHTVKEYLIGGGFNQNFDFLRREISNEELSTLESIVEITRSSNQSQVQLKKIARKLNWSFSHTKRHIDRLRNGLILQLEGPTANPYCSFTIDLVRQWLENNYWFFTP